VFSNKQTNKQTKEETNKQNKTKNRKINFFPFPPIFSSTGFQIKYCIFSIQRLRRLFQTWHGGPSVSLNKQFIWVRHFLRKGYYSFFLTAVYPALKS